MALRLRRGSDAQRLVVTPEQGELIYVTDTKKLYVGDGSTQGGVVVSSEVQDDTSPSLSGDLNLDGNDVTGTGNIDITGNITSTGTLTTSGLGDDLDLNGNNIVGTGNINIAGTITATGNITLGDGSEDNINVGGLITSNLVPDTNKFYNIGGPGAYWANGFFGGLTVAGHINAGSFSGDLIADDSTVAYSAETGVFTGYFEGDIKGSIFGDDSFTIVDAVSQNVNARNIDVTNNLTANRHVFGSVSLLADPLSSNQIILEPTVPDTTGLASTLLINSYSEGNSFPSRSTLQLSGTHLDESYNDYDEWINGRIVFSRTDIDGDAAPAVVTSRTSRFEIKVHDRNSPSSFPEAHGIYLRTENGYFGVGVNAPTAALHNPRDTQLGDIYINQNTISMTDTNGNLRLATNGTGTIELEVPTQITVGSPGAAAAIPANPDIYFKVNINGTDYVVPGFAVA